MEGADLTDEQIAEAVQAGDRERFSILVERYQDRLLRYGRRILFNQSDLEDIVQEIFIKAYKNLQSFDAARKFSAWIYRIAHNEFINHGKWKSRQLVDYFDLEILLPHRPSEDGPARDVDRGEMRELLEHSLEGLDVKYREPLLLYYFEEMDYKEIADVLRIPVNTVGIRILRGKAQLKKHLEGKV
jgi:RNA polymerase sigma-70 factor (ECF subfamily)